MSVSFHSFVNVLVVVLYTELRIKQCIHNRKSFNQKRFIQAFRKFTIPNV